MSVVYDDLVRTIITFNMMLARANMSDSEPEITITFKRDRDLFEFVARLKVSMPQTFSAIINRRLDQNLIDVAGRTILLRSAERYALRYTPPGDPS